MWSAEGNISNPIQQEDDRFIIYCSKDPKEKRLITVRDAYQGLIHIFETIKADKREQIWSGVFG